MASATAPYIVPPNYFRDILQFNFLPTQYMDDSWWQGDWLKGVSLGCKQFPTRSQFYLSRFFLRQNNLSGQFDFDFSLAWKLVALLPGPLLKRLAYLTGLTFQSQRIAHVIQSNVRQTIKNSIGTTDYFFALKRGTRLLKEAQIQSPLPATQRACSFDTLKADCLRLGVSSLATITNDLLPAFVRRLQLKLPKTLVENHWQAAASNKDVHLRLVLRLAKELA